MIFLSACVFFALIVPNELSVKHDSNVHLSAGMRNVLPVKLLTQKLSFFPFIHPCSHFLDSFERNFWHPQFLPTSRINEVNVSELVTRQNLAMDVIDIFLERKRPPP